MSLIAIGTRGETLPRHDTPYPIYYSATGSLGKDYNVIVERCKRDNVDWLLLGSDHLFVGELSLLPSTQVAMLPIQLGKPDGTYMEKIDASTWLIHRSAFDLKHDPAFLCYWEDYHLVYNVWKDVEFSALDAETKMHAYHPWHEPRQHSLDTEPKGHTRFHEEFNRLHGFEFQVGRFPNVWRAAKDLRFSTSVNPE